MWRILLLFQLLLRIVDVLVRRERR
jgi:hypothetical protein